ncbi:hypothetical protein ACWCPF_44135 [Streptomyces sp. NPDC001858]
MTEAHPLNLPNHLHEGLLAIPSGSMAEASLAAARAAVHPSVLNHSIRGFFWARVFAAVGGVTMTVRIPTDAIPHPHSS